MERKISEYMPYIVDILFNLGNRVLLMNMEYVPYDHVAPNIESGGRGQL